MIEAIFFTWDDQYACSNQVDLQFKGAVKKDNTLLALKCFSIGRLPEINALVDCIIKYNDLPSIAFKGCVRAVNGNKDVLIRVASPFSTDQAKQIIERIAGLV